MSLRKIYHTDLKLWDIIKLLLYFRNFLPWKSSYLEAYSMASHPDFEYCFSTLAL